MLDWEGERVKAGLGVLALEDGGGGLATSVRFWKLAL